MNVRFNLHLFICSFVQHNMKYDNVPPLVHLVMRVLKSKFNLTTIFVFYFQRMGLFPLLNL